MSWSDLYLICFIVGFALSLISLLSGFFDWHLPGLDHGHVDIGHGHVHAHGPMHAHGPVSIGDAHGHAGVHISPFNFPTMTAFLAWFGGVGYLLTRFSGIWLWLAFFFAVIGGLLGGSIVFAFLAKLVKYDRAMDPADYDMIGMLGELTSAIREGGTGEMSFSQAGARRSTPARSDDGSAIEKGANVFVTRYEKGIAYVKPWADLNELKETL